MRIIDVQAVRPSRSRLWSRTVACGLALALSAALGWRTAVSPHAELAGAPTVVRTDLGADELATVELFRRSSPAVVHIANVAVFASRRRDPVEIPLGTGTGFVWDDAGHVVTNYHVIAERQNADRKVFVTFVGEDKPLEALVVGQSPNHDIAVLKLVEKPRQAPQPLQVGTSSNLLVGQRVYAIGNPFGLDQTLTTGVISGLKREIRSTTQHRIGGVIQTDAAINPGNSGGPLLDSSGRLIGMNTAIVSPSGAYAGIGFAVPADVVRRVVPELIERGSVARPGLGIVLLDAERSARLGIGGIGIARVAPGGAAEHAGLQSLVAQRTGEVTLDVIVSIDGTPVQAEENLFDALDARSVGDVVRLGVRRGTQLLEVDVRLQSID